MQVKNVLRLLVISLSMQMEPAFALDIFSNKLKVYTCASESSAMSCLNCRLEQTDRKINIFIDFKIDKSKGNIIYRWFEGVLWWAATPRKSA